MSLAEEVLSRALNTLGYVVMGWVGPSCPLEAGSIVKPPNTKWGPVDQPFTIIGPASREEFDTFNDAIGLPAAYLYDEPNLRWFKAVTD